MITADNPFFAPSELPYRLPPFNKIKDEHFLPAFEAGLAAKSAEVVAIADNPEEPTFQNTLEALERSGALLDRVISVFFNLTGSDINEERQAIKAKIAPRLAALNDAMFLNPALFAKIDGLFARREELSLDGESLRLLEHIHRQFQRAGAGLSEQDQTRLRELNEELSTLSTQFQDNLLNDTNDLALLVEDVEELSGLDSSAISAAGEAAASRGESGKYLLKLELPTLQPLLASLENRDVRKRLYTASISRGNRGNAFDNKTVLATIAAVRAERAMLLGYPHHAAYVISDKTAATADNARNLLERLAPSAVANANAEAEELQDYLNQDVPGAQLEPWDWSFYAERVRLARYSIDDSLLRPYFELDNVINDGVFYAAQRLYGLTFTERHDLPKYHSQVRTFEVFDSSGAAIGLFLADYYTRDSKRGGAWMNDFVLQSELLDHQPVVVNNLNIVKPPAGEPTLLTIDEVETAFHEFGHALHSLFSQVRYPSLAGTEVPTDFVEFPSQVNEMWMWWPEVLAHYAKHHQTGEPLPSELIDKLIESRQYGEGFATTEYLAASLLDLAWHELGAQDKVDDVLEFQSAALEKAGVALSTVSPRYRSTYFAHIFSGGYSAGYYSYIWSEVLDADTVDWFKENGGLTRENGEKFRRELLSRGNSIDPMEAFRNVRGRDSQIAPLLRRRGLTGA
jgi:peptidyl-dipeptidase Dcp